MSTFNGLIAEFPEIRIDFFRRHPDLTPPSACFLSHIHSDHLQGLESPVLPFVYCSAATKRLLLRMEKYPHRINFAKGILEARKQTYRHLKKVLKPLPLQTPTVIELTPKSSIRVTLFDANHCPGAVMFLIEGSGTAILYTGDIRGEAWWVNSIIRHPTMIPYTLGSRRLDCIYMDTTFAAKEDVYRTFPSKAEGLAELIEKVSQYPPETTFYFRSWTLGYEDAWLALSSALSSRVHVDAYQYRLYHGLLEDHSERISVPEAAPLVGFFAGNHPQDGCLTDDSTIPVRIHSCEPGTACHAELFKRPNVVYITPIISRSPDGTETYEVGAGGGGGDLYQTPELDITDAGVLQALQSLCVNLLKDPVSATNAIAALEAMATSGNRRISLESISIDLNSEHALTLQEFIRLISDPLANSKDNTASKLTATIRFPYSRHSSYSELHSLVSAFKPRDICPCTVDLDTWSEEVSMENLFGDLCPARIFAYDSTNRILAAERRDIMSASRKRKRDMNNDGNKQRSEEAGDDSFEMANDLLQLHNINPREMEVEEKQHAPVTATTEDGNLSPSRHLHPKADMEEDNGIPNKDEPSHRLQAIQNAFHAIQGTDTLAEGPGLTSIRWQDMDGAMDNEQKLKEPTAAAAAAIASADHPSQSSSSSMPSSSAFDSQSYSVSEPHPHPLSPPAAETEAEPAVNPHHRASRMQARKEAYRAARQTLRGDHGGDHLSWDELGVLRSVPGRGHGEEEVEL